MNQPATPPYMGSGTTVLHGVVASFDPVSATGVVTGDDGVDYPFHCIEVADGTRTIEAGRRVTFQRLARFGRWQAAAVGT